jgi:uncharacterized membrane protein
MRVQILNYLDRVRSSFWFLPAVMAGGAVALAFASVAVDRSVTDWLTTNWGLTFRGGAEGASALLGAIAGSMITIAGVVFSMTLVALSLASSQLGPRLLRVFMRDTTTQIALGTFVATFLYCLLVLRTIRRVDEFAFVPHLSVAVSALLAVVSMGMLIYFIHHMSLSIQANEMVTLVGKELIDGIERLFPEQVGQEAPRIPTDTPDKDFLDALDREACPVGSAEDGYLQLIDGDALMALAVEEDVVIRLERRPGQYVVLARPLVLVWPGDRVTDPMMDRVNSAFSMGNQRTSVQDTESVVNELVEIAIRALSSGVNDPFTAVTCVDRLGSALCFLAQREMPSPYRYDTKDQLRVIAPVITFSDITNAAFDQIRQYGRSSYAVTIRLLETIAVVAGYVHRPEDRAVLRRHAEMIVRGASEGLPEAEDRRAVEELYQKVSQLCSEPTGG